METLTAFRGWLIDYYVATGVMLIAVAIVMSFARQPARRIAVAWLKIPYAKSAVAGPPGHLVK